MNTTPLMHNETTNREPWPEVDRLAVDAKIDVQQPLGWYTGTKVLLDYTLTLLMLPIALPVMALCALAIKLTSRGPIFYSQTRLGLHGRHYRILKLRTMYHNCELHSGIRWSNNGDQRITRIGKFLRATHLDELPQLFNVLLGQMSLVGPRPERPEVIAAKALNQLVPGYKHRLLTRPGVTGLAQLQLPADSDITGVRYKIVYDLYYVQNQSLMLDLRLILATAFKTIGAGPRVLRNLFWLPSRQRVEAVFRGNVVAAPEVIPTLLQPA